MCLRLGVVQRVESAFEPRYSHGRIAEAANGTISRDRFDDETTPHWRRDLCTPGLSFFQRLVATDDDTRRQNQDCLRSLLRDHSTEVSVHSAHCPVEFTRYAETTYREAGSPTL